MSNLPFVVLEKRCTFTLSWFFFFRILIIMLNYSGRTVLFCDICLKIIYIYIFTDVACFFSKKITFIILYQIFHDPNNILDHRYLFIYDHFFQMPDVIVVYQETQWGSKSNNNIDESSCSETISCLRYRYLKIYLWKLR